MRFMSDCAHAITEKDELYRTRCCLCHRYQKAYTTLWCWKCFSRMPVDKTTGGSSPQCVRCKNVVPREIAFVREETAWVFR